MNTTAGGPATGTSSLRTLTLRTISVPYPRRLCYHVKQRTGRMRCQADDAGAESSGDQGIQGSPWTPEGARGEAEFLSALQEAQERSKLSQKEGSDQPDTTQRLPPRPAGPSRQTLARIEKARQYREMADRRFSGKASDETTPAPGDVAPGPDSQVARERKSGLQPARPLSLQNGDSSSQQASATNTAATPDEEASPSTSSAEVPSVRTPTTSRMDTGKGSANKAANFLQNVIREGPKMEEGLSMEQFTLRKEAEMKARGAEVITIDGQASADGTESGYRPKVATWGVFPRPQNISEAFGGGRNIRPGQELESEADKLARQERVKVAMSAYRKQMGLDIDPEVERACRAAYEAGMQLLTDGRLKEAVVQFEVTVNGMSVRTQLGGEARLQKAICLDSLGQSEEAYSLYRQIQMHPSPTVAKRAKRMLFGFEAAENLKAHTMSYAPSKGEYDKYFRRMRSDWNSAYVAPEGESADNYTLTTVVATAVMLSPILLVGAKVGSTLLKP